MIDPDILDLIAVSRTLFRHRLRIIGVAVFVGLVTAVAVALFAKYRSEGVYTLAAIAGRDIIPDAPTAPRGNPVLPKAPYVTKGVALQEFKTEYPQLDWERFALFLASKKIAIDDEIERTERALSNGDLRQELLIPLYGSTRADLRELGEQSKPIENLVLGFRIVYDSSTGAGARRIVSLLGDFAGETTFRSHVDALIARRLETYETQALSLANELIVTRFTMVQMAEKSARLRGLRKEFPEVADASSRQVVSIADGGSLYLSPSAQLVGLESNLADQRQSLATMERQRGKAELLAKFYAKATQLASLQQSSSAFLAGMAKLVDSSLVNTGDRDDVIAEARNDALLDVHVLQVLREQGLRFVSGPTAGKRDEARIWKYALIAALVAAILGILITLLVSSPVGVRKVT